MKILNTGEALIMGLEKINLHNYPRVKVLGVTCTGLDHLPWDQINERKIKVISLAQPRDRETEEFLNGITSTAEHTLGLIIALLRNYKSALNFPYNRREFYKGYTLRKKQFGIIGCGRIGKQIVESMSLLTLKNVYFYDAKKLLGEEREFVTAYERLIKFKSLEYILKTSDIISLHIPLQNNEGFFTKKMFKMMKPTAYLINTSRSGIIKRGALLWALENKIIAGAAQDFIDDIDLVYYSRDNSNLILTSHIGGCTFEDTEATKSFIEKKVVQYLKTNKL